MIELFLLLISLFRSPWSGLHAPRDTDPSDSPETPAGRGLNHNETFLE